VLASLAAMPGVVLFRIRPAAAPAEPDAEQSPSPLVRVE
jgi:hypothetical protein